jgi:hypothetical protein
MSEGRSNECTGAIRQPRSKTGSCLQGLDNTIARAPLLVDSQVDNLSRPASER